MVCNFALFYLDNVQMKIDVGASPCFQEKGARITASKLDCIGPILLPSTLLTPGPAKQYATHKHRSRSTKMFHHLAVLIIKHK